MLGSRGGEKPEIERLDGVPDLSTDKRLVRHLRSVLAKSRASEAALCFGEEGGVLGD